jgi:hypothetical protein
VHGLQVHRCAHSYAPPDQWLNILQLDAKDGVYSEIAVAQSPEWTPEMVLKRGLDILDFLERRWAISFGGREKRVQFLNLNFMP